MKCFFTAELDTRLKQLALEAQQYPLKSQQRQQALTNLVSLIEKSGKLCHPYKGQFQGLYLDIYAEAKQRLFFHICDKIDDYNPKWEVLQWANFLLRNRFFIAAVRDVFPIYNQRKKIEKLHDFPINDLYNQYFLQAKFQSSPSLLQQIIQSLEEDPDGIFKSTYISNQPAANFQFLAMQLVSGYSWKEISAELGIKISTLNSFYHRCLIKFKPKFQEYLS